MFILILIIIVTSTVYPRLVINHDFNWSRQILYICFIAYATSGVPMLSLKTLAIRFGRLASYKKKHLYIYKGWVKKKCDIRRLVQKSTFFLVQLSCMVNFLKIWNFFWYFNDPKKKIREPFFFQNQKFRKTNMCK